MAREPAGSQKYLVMYCLEERVGINNTQSSIDFPVEYKTQHEYKCYKLKQRLVLIPIPILGSSTKIVLGCIHVLLPNLATDQRTFIHYYPVIILMLVHLYAYIITLYTNALGLSEPQLSLIIQAS